MKEKVMQGKLYVGDSHLRFDKRETASFTAKALLQRMRSVCILLLFLSPLPLYAAKTTVFVGQANVADGDKFSVVGNWSNGLPEAGDTVVISSVVETVWNDYEENFLFASISMVKNQDAGFASELRGNAVRLSNTYYLYNGCKSYLEVASSGKDLYLGGNGSSEFHGRITTGSGHCRLYISNNNSVYMYAPLIVNGTLQSNGNASYRNGSLFICSTGNYFKTSSIWYNNVNFTVNNAVEPEFVIGWGDTNKENNRGMYRFGATDQTANRIIGTPTRTTGCQIDGTGTLTLNGTADAVSPCLIQGSLSVVWNPSGDFTQTFTNRAHATTGTLTVSNGTMRLAAGGSFNKVKRITVASGATFELATPTAGTLAELTALDVDGTFRFADSSADPFGSASLVVMIGANGSIYVPSGVTVCLPSVCLNGVWLAEDDYSGVDWISGGGTVTVGNSGVSSWKSAIGGSWSDGSKWVDGMVPSTSPAYITAMGASYDVAFDAPAFLPSEIHIGNDAAHTTRLIVSGDRSCVSDGSTSFKVSDGGAFEISSGMIALTNASAAVAAVTGTGVWRVTGGTNEIQTGWNGFSLKDGGTLQVNAGLFKVQNKLFSYGNGLYLGGGRIEISGEGKFRSENASGEFNPLGSGEVLVKDNASFYLGRAFAGPRIAGVPLHIVLTNSASFTGNAGAFFGDTLTGGSTFIELFGDSMWNFGWEGAIGLNRSCHVRMDVNRGAFAAMGSYGGHIGGVDTKKDTIACFPTGVVNVAGGTFNGNGGYYGSNANMNAPGKFQGLIVGGAYAPGCTVNNTRRSLAGNVEYAFKGELNVTDGGVYTQKGYLAVGMDRGDGAVRINGGTMTKTTAGEVLVGICGGRGLLEVTGGGAATSASPIYVGGVDPSTLAIPRTWPEADSSSTAATGLVAVVDGSLAVTGGFVLGACGTGILEIGSNGVVTASSMTLSNNVLSKLSFKFGEGGVGRIVLSGALTVSDGAKLEIDASAYQGKRGRFRLLSAGAVSGAFAPVDVDIISEDGRMTYALDGNSLYALRPNGSVFTLR